MKVFVRGGAALVLAAISVLGTAGALEKTVLTSDRDKVSYAIGMDVGSSIKPVGPDMDVAAFEQAVRNAFQGNKPILSKEEAIATDGALRARIGARVGKPAPGTTPGAQPPAVNKVKVGQLVGAYQG
jgi:FKBP-type peptidyl-prolyl cis-trans isomerase FkpA